MKNTPVTQDLLSWILNEDHFQELSLTPNGDLFINPDRTVKADQFWVYFKPVVYLGGSLYVNYDGAFFRYGEMLDHEKCFKLRKNKTQINLLGQGDIQLFSQRAGIPTGSTLIAFFRYRNKAVLILAGEAFKRHSHTLILESTEESNALLFREFSEILGKCDLQMAEYLAASQDSTPVECIISTTESIVS